MWNHLSWNVTRTVFFQVLALFLYSYGQNYIIFDLITRNFLPTLPYQTLKNDFLESGTQGSSYQTSVYSGIDSNGCLWIKLFSKWVSVWCSHTLRTLHWHSGVPNNDDGSLAINITVYVKKMPGVWKNLLPEYQNNITKNCIVSLPMHRIRFSNLTTRVCNVT